MVLLHHRDVVGQEQEAERGAGIELHGEVAAARPIKREDPVDRSPRVDDQVRRVVQALVPTVLGEGQVIG